MGWRFRKPLGGAHKQSLLGWGLRSAKDLRILEGGSLSGQLMNMYEVNGSFIRAILDDAGCKAYLCLVSFHNMSIRGLVFGQYTPQSLIR